MSYSDDLKELATRYVERGGVQVFVKTNYGPEMPLYTGSDGDQGGLSEVIGLKAQIIVKNRSGQVIATYGEPVKTDPVKVAMAGAVLGGIAWILWRAI